MFSRSRESGRALRGVSPEGPKGRVYRLTIVWLTSPDFATQSIAIKLSIAVKSSQLKALVP